MEPFRPDVLLIDDSKQPQNHQPQKPSSHVHASKKGRRGQCQGCKSKDCGTCKFCKDKNIWRSWQTEEILYGTAMPREINCHSSKVSLTNAHLLLKKNRNSLEAMLTSLVLLNQTRNPTLPAYFCNKTEKSNQSQVMAIVFSCPVILTFLEPSNNIYKFVQKQLVCQ